VRVQFLPFCPKLETSEKQGAADVEKRFFSVFVIKLFKESSEVIW
jgi:hypothetical protein